MNELTLHPIGVIHTPHTEPARTPIQPVYAEGIQGEVEVNAAFADGLADLEGFSHIYLVYHFHKAEQEKLLVKPYLEDVSRGVFATRAPCHPNRIGFSVVRLLEVQGNRLLVEDVDMLDGTPLLDIKPYIARFDTRTDVHSGWQDGIAETTAQQRGRRG